MAILIYTNPHLALYFQQDFKISCMNAADVRSSSEAQRSGDMPSSAEDFKLAAIHGDMEEGTDSANYMEHHCSRRQQKAFGIVPRVQAHTRHLIAAMMPVALVRIAMLVV